MYYLLKVIISAILIVLISEMSKKSSLFGAIVASLPIISILAFIWLYVDTKSIDEISRLSTSIFWLVIPSLVLFISLPLFLNYGIGFYGSLFFSMVLTVISYYIMITLLEKFGVNL